MKTCDVPHCKGVGKPVYIYYGEKPVAHYCDKHAQQRGFCISCGVHEFPEGEGVDQSGLCLACEMALYSESESLPVFDSFDYAEY